MEEIEGPQKEVASYQVEGEKKKDPRISETHVSCIHEQTGISWFSTSFGHCEG